MIAVMRDTPSKFTRANWGGEPPFKLVPPAPQPRSRYFYGLVLLCALAGFVSVQAWPHVIAAFKPADAQSASVSTSISVRVIDGDTISLDDGRANVRLVGFNAPETGSRARCETERQKGEAAKQRLRELVEGGRLDFRQVACSCPPGTEGTEACNFGRRCGILNVDDRDVGASLVAEGLAVRFVCGPTACPALPRPWC